MSRLRLSQYFARTGQVLRDNTSRSMHAVVFVFVLWTEALPLAPPPPVLRMQGTEEPSRAPKHLLKFHTKEDIQNIATGCDADIGGTSSVHFDLDGTNTAAPAQAHTTLKPNGVLDAVKVSTGKFWGEMKLGVHEGLQGKIRGGYAGFRSKVRHGR